ncbi:helix-turn-helix domain-containing protein [Flavitalea sp. BT771]|uniref:helix-turn-helix domain-containing protein n=1 Tax=Flavitalea sp. BT771 TaxID=3063329 RepID=UPI0026E492FA|nr:helix-turn-helix domain-containing protein [Flavitalea sp. BT771]MDO6431667.1 helix-turn-helix domain-containing protein [Flavitalea sp. BT771]MDV6220575.1 helix-turn-helix domain-containing protein [Flavitalea sp. BT771]
MQYQEYIPSKALSKYIKCYYIYVSGSNIVIEDKAFATGCVEMMFNLEGVQWEININNQFVSTPGVELWGQIIKPLAFRTPGKNRMFGIRFYPHAASAFLNEDISLFNDSVTDLTGVIGQPVQELHRKLVDAGSAHQRIALVETFLLKRLSLFEKKLDKLELVQAVMSELKKEDFFDNISNVASRYGITSRYLQKIFLLHTGITPKLYSKINRFQNSLLLIGKGGSSLTSIAYDCGYADQSHFIRDFKSFTGNPPSVFNIDNTSALLASPNK